MMTTGPKYPEIEVQLSGEDGNAFYILGVVRKALRRNVNQEAADEFFEDATSADYDHLLQVAMRYVSVA